MDLDFPCQLLLKSNLSMWDWVKTACWKSACMGKHKTRTRHWTVWHRILTEVYISREILEMVSMILLHTSILVFLLFEAIWCSRHSFKKFYGSWVPATRLGACSPGTEKEPRRHKKEKESSPELKEKGKMTKGRRQRVWTMPLDSFSHLKPHFLSCNSF